MSSEQNKDYYIKVNTLSKWGGTYIDIRSTPEIILYLINLAIYTESYKSH